jgi:serine protease AprX
MRLRARQSHRFLLATLAVATPLSALCSPAAALAGSHSTKLDSTLASAVDKAVASGNRELHVLAFGTNLQGANGSVGTAARNELPFLGAESVTVPAADVDRLAAHAGVTFLTLDKPVIPTDAPAAPAPLFDATGLLTLYPVVDNAQHAWANGFTGAGIGIAIVDSGVTARRDFGDRLVQVTLPTQDGTKLDDRVGHGSFVAGVAAGTSGNGRYVGIAPGATVYAVNVAREDGVYTSDVIAGLRWVLMNAKAKNIRVVNLSLSQTSPSQYTSSTLDAAVERLWKAGIVVVASAGNLGSDSMLYAPANDPFAISVGASDPNDTETPADDTLASFSSYGRTQSDVQKPELVAPGRHIYSTVPGGATLLAAAPAANVVRDGAEVYLRMNGTSFSAPQVAGAVALLLQQRPDLTPDQVKWVLTTSSRPVIGSDAGALDVKAATALLAAPGSANAGVPYSTWAKSGSTMMDFVNLISAALRATAYERSAAIMERNATAACARPPAATARTKDVKAFWTRCAQAYERAAAAWDDAADAWGDASTPDKAALAAKNAAADWSAAHDAWDTALMATQALASSARAQASLDRQASWDKQASWDHQASWDQASWDQASWDQASWD